MNEQRVVAGYGAPIVHLARDGRTLCDRRVGSDWTAAQRERTQCRRCLLARHVEREQSS
jgi:hypothetical protein